MTYCPRCGQKNSEDAVYCSNCGQKMEGPVAPQGIPDIGIKIEREIRTKGSDYLDGVGFGVFLITIAYVYLQHPRVFDQFFSWLRSWGVAGGPTMIPVVLIDPIALFMIIMAIWGIVQGVIRITWGRFRKGVGNLIGGGFGLALAYVLYLYRDGLLSSSSVVPIFVILLGVSIVASVLAEIPTRR